MSKKGLLKAEFNRVRTSTALKANDMWTNTIGMEQDPQAGSNAAVEASIYAPTRGGGNRIARQEKALEMAQSAGYQSMATDYKGLLSLAKAQGIGNELRGACKLCGCLGHLTKKCTNVLTGHKATSGMDVVRGPGSAAAEAPGAGPMVVLGMLPELGSISDLDSSDVSSSGSDSDGDSDSSGDSRDRKRKRRSREGKDKSKDKGKDRSKSKKHKKEKSKKKHKSSKDKRSSKKHRRSSPS